MTETLPLNRYKLEIHLPEGVTFSLPLAGPVSRALAFLIDIFIITGLTAGIEGASGSIRALYEDLGTGLLILSYFAAWLLYGILCEYYWRGQTIGKWLLSLRVVDASGLELKFYQVAIRNLIRSLDLLPVLGLLGIIVMLSTRRLQRLGDLAAGTVVMRNHRPSTPNIEALVKHRYNSLLEHQVLCARLRQRAAPEAAAIAVEALMRRDGLEDRARVLLFDDLAAYFHALVDFPAEDIEQISSEQYVRNVVEILYSASAKRKPAAVMR